MTEGDQKKKEREAGHFPLNKQPTRRRKQIRLLLLSFRSASSSSFVRTNSPRNRT